MVRKTVTQGIKKEGAKRILKGKNGYFERDGFHCTAPFGNIPNRTIKGKTLLLYLEGSSLGRTVFFGAASEKQYMKEELYLRRGGKRINLLKSCSSVILRPDRSIYICSAPGGDMYVSVFPDPVLPVKVVRIDRHTEKDRFSYLIEPPKGYVKLPIKNGYCMISPFSECAYFVIEINSEKSSTLLFGRYPRKNPRLIAYIQKKYKSEAPDECYRIERDLLPFRCIIPDKKAQIMINSYLPRITLSQLSGKAALDNLRYTLALYCSLFYDEKLCKRKLFSLAFNRLEPESDPLSLPFLLASYVFMTEDYAITLEAVPYKNGGTPESLYYHAYRSLTEKSERIYSSPLFFMKERIFRLFSDLSRAVGSEKEIHRLSLVLDSLDEGEGALCDPLLREASHYEGMLSILSEKLCEKDAPIILFGIIDGIFKVRISPSKGAVSSFDTPLFSEIRSDDKDDKKYRSDGRLPY